MTDSGKKMSLLISFHGIYWASITLKQCQLQNRNLSDSKSVDEKNKTCLNIDVLIDKKS